MPSSGTWKSHRLTQQVAASVTLLYRRWNNSPAALGLLTQGPTGRSKEDVVNRLTSQHHFSWKKVWTWLIGLIYLENCLRYLSHLYKTLRLIIFRPSSLTVAKQHVSYDTSCSHSYWMSGMRSAPHTSQEAFDCLDSVFYVLTFWTVTIKGKVICSYHNIVLL